LGFFNQVCAFENDPVQIVGNACIDLFFLSHVNCEQTAPLDDSTALFC
jgi:hypothetical protein